MTGRYKYIKEKREKDREREGGRGKRGLLFAPHFLPAFCSILLRMTSAAHPRSVSLSFPLSFILCFSSSFHWPFPSCVRFPSLWNYLLRLTCPGAHTYTLSPTDMQFYLQLNYLRVPFRMLQNNQLESLPDDAPWDLPNLLSL